MPDALDRCPALIINIQVVFNWGLLKTRDPESGIRNNNNNKKKMNIRRHENFNEV